MTPETLTQKRRRAAMARRTHGGGGDMGGRRPLDPVRCPCGASSLRRAIARCFRCCRDAGINEAAIAAVKS